MHNLSKPEWIAITAHRLQYRWRSIPPRQLDETAAELWNDAHLRELGPEQAADAWLSPVLLPDTSVT